jgi:hypothetical protein
MDKPEQRERTLLLIFLQRLRRAAVVTFAPVERLRKPTNSPSSSARTASWRRRG